MLCSTRTNPSCFNHVPVPSAVIFETFHVNDEVSRVNKRKASSSPAKVSNLLGMKKRKVEVQGRNTLSNMNQQRRIPKKQQSPSMPGSLLTDKLVPLQNAPNKTTTKGRSHSCKHEQKLKEHRLNLSKEIKLNGGNKSVNKKASKEVESIMKKPNAAVVSNKEGFLQGLTTKLRKTNEIYFPKNPVTKEEFYTPEAASVEQIKLLDCALYGSLQEMVTCLKHESSTQGDIQEALGSLKKDMFKKLKEVNTTKLSTSSTSNPKDLQDKKEALECLEQKIMALKIFIKAEATIKQAVKLLHEDTRPVCDLKVEMDTVCNWIKKFQEHPIVKKDNEYMIEADITCSDGTNMSLLHAAVILNDPEQIKYVLCLGADAKIDSKEWGTAYKLAKKLQLNK